jgi:hypothetical protein
MRVKGIGSGYWRVVGEVEELVDKAKEMAQHTLFGMGFARILSKMSTDCAELFLPRQRLGALACTGLIGFEIDNSLTNCVGFGGRWL